MHTLMRLIRGILLFISIQVYTFVAQQPSSSGEEALANAAIVTSAVPTNEQLLESSQFAQEAQRDAIVTQENQIPPTIPSPAQVPPTSALEEQNKQEELLRLERQNSGSVSPSTAASAAGAAGGTTAVISQQTPSQTTTAVPPVTATNVPSVPPVTQPAQITIGTTPPAPSVAAPISAVASSVPAVPAPVAQPQQTPVVPPAVPAPVPPAVPPVTPPSSMPVSTTTTPAPVPPAVSAAPAAPVVSTAPVSYIIQPEQLPQPVSPQKPAITIPTPPTPSSIQLEDEKRVEEPLGIDTVNLDEPQGNWLFKRIWWERAQERYEKIRALVDQVWEYRVTFFTARSEIDRTVLDPFYLSIGYGQGELQQILNDLISTAQQERPEDNNDERNTLLQESQKHKEKLEELRSDIGNINQLDNAVDKALDVMMEEISKVRLYEREAWNSFKEIAQVLSDSKARDLYYKMDVLWHNIKDIYKYLQTDFTQSFQEIGQKIRSETERIKQDITTLKEAGIDFKNQQKTLTKAVEAAEVTPSVETEQEDEIVVEPQGKWASIWQGIKDSTKMIIDGLMLPFSWMYNKIVGNKADLQEDLPLEDENSQENSAAAPQMEEQIVSEETIEKSE